MAPWQLNQLVWQRREGTTWTTNPLTLTAGDVHLFRGFFTIANGDEPIAAGNLLPRRNLDGAGWQDLARIVEAVEPGYTQGQTINQPEIIEWFIAFQPSLVGNVDTRLKLDWPGGPYFTSPPINVTVLPQVVDEAAPHAVVEAVVPDGVVAAAVADLMALSWVPGRAPVVAAVPDRALLATIADVAVLAFEGLRPVVTSAVADGLRVAVVPDAPVLGVVPALAPVMATVPDRVRVAHVRDSAVIGTVG